MPATGDCQPRVSVLMPTYNHRHFIRRAIESLLAQELGDWELVIVDDGSTDGTAESISRFLADPRVRLQRLPHNEGLGAALNHGLEHARAPLIAYLPADDVMYSAHLRSLVDRLEEEPQAVLAYTGVRHHYNRIAPGQIEGTPLQLVQVMHRRTADRWVERSELVTDDLDRMFWTKLQRRGRFIPTGQVTCEWVNHPEQRHKIIQEPLGGINPYRSRYRVQQPLRFHSSVGNRIDEVAQYRRFRDRPNTPMAADGLKILLVGELAYNAERVLALEEHGHKLYGLWTPEPYCFNTVGPLPFGHVEELPATDWQAAVRRIQPDVIYALLNWQAVPFVHQVLVDNPGIPFIWHFKEGPFICIEKGLWSQLLDLYTRADGQVYSSPEMREWFNTVVPGITDNAPSLVLDGDLPKREWFTGRLTPRRSDQDGELHTVVPGRPIGLHPPTVGELAAQGIHLHFYGDFTQGQWRDWIEKTNQLAEGYLHLHPQVDQENWTREFSQYDAGWLHYFRSENQGDLRRSNWDDLNYPARIATLVMAGLPLLQFDNKGAIVAAQTLVKQREIGLFFRGMEELRVQLCDEQRMSRLRDNVWRQREEFSFDYHVDTLIGFFRRVIASRKA